MGRIEKSGQNEENVSEISKDRDSFAPEIVSSHPDYNLQCLVFRTSLHNRKDVENISAVLDNLPGISDWYVDLDDREKILRIECTGLSATAIIDTLLKKGVIAKELPV